MRVILPFSGGHEIVNEWAIAPSWFGIITCTVLVFLLLVTFAFRSVGTRH